MENYLFLEFPNDLIKSVGSNPDGLLVKGVPKRTDLGHIIVDEGGDFYTLIVVHNNLPIDAKRFVRINRNITAIILKDGEDFSVNNHNYFVKERRIFRYGD